MEPLLALLAAAEKLKQTKRAGWVQRAVPSAESVADHSYRVALLAMILADDADINKETALQMALLHDLAESITGDITPMDNIDPAQKHRDEEAAMRRLLNGLPNADAFFALWMEYEADETAEARFVHDLDILERVTQAAEYQKQHGIDLSMFFVEPDRYIRHPLLCDLAKQAIVKNGGSVPKRSESTM